MKIVVESLVPGPQARVFGALIDPELLERCVPGCESLVAAGDDVYEATLKIGVAGLKGLYRGKATIREKKPPDSLTLAFECKGGPGFVRGSAAIRLASEEGGTRVNCEADVQVGGSIAAVGSRLVQAAARKLAADFFRQLSKQVSPT